MKKFAVMLVACLLVSGCATPGNIWKSFLGVSTQDLEDRRPEAAVKVFEYDYKTCYEKTEELLKRMPSVNIYARDKGMIAIFYINPDTTPVGIFFKEVDATHTQVEISSESTVAKDWIAKNIFSETVVVQEKANIKF